MSDSAGPAPPVSVVCCSYNGEAFIEETLNSIRAQTYADFEVIVFDDLSTDRTVEVAKAFADPRVKVIVSDERVPVGEARNRALKHAKGEWIGFIDQDDLWTERKLELQLKAADEANTGNLGLVYGRTKRFGAVRSETNFDPWFVNRPLPQGDIFAALLSKPAFVAMSSALISRQALDDVGEVPEWVELCPDYYLFLAIAKSWRAVAVEELCCLYRVHGASMTYTYTAGIHAEAFEIIKHLAEPEHDGIVRQRGKVANTLIAMDDIKKGALGPGVRRLLTEGSIPYFLGRPFFHKLRTVMNQAGRKT